MDSFSLRQEPHGLPSPETKPKGNLISFFPKNGSNNTSYWEQSIVPNSNQPPPIASRGKEPSERDSVLSEERTSSPPLSPSPSPRLHPRVLARSSMKRSLDHFLNNAKIKKTTNTKPEHKAKIFLKKHNLEAYYLGVSQAAKDELKKRFSPNVEVETELIGFKLNMDFDNNVDEIGEGSLTLKVKFEYENKDVCTEYEF